MLLVLSAVSTALFAVWLLLLFSAGQEDWVAAAYNQILNNREEIQKLRRRDLERQARLDAMEGLAARLYPLFYTCDSSKAIAKLEKKNGQLQKGNFRSVPSLDVPGYALLRRLPDLRHSSLYKRLLSDHQELYGRKYAARLTNQLLARMLSYPVAGIAAALALGVLAFGSGNRNGGLAIMGVGSLLVLFLVYALYDDVNDKVNKRRRSIRRQFPNVVSKLALLVTSGMIMDRAWSQTAESSESELYQEMRLTAKELDNMVPPQEAYANFIARCNTKETAKLASAIMQNLSKGNAEIGRLLKDMAAEAWLERRNLAMRDSEAANTKLMIPTMLLLVTILVMLMVPIAMNFSGL